MNTITSNNSLHYKSNMVLLLCLSRVGEGENGPFVKAEYRNTGNLITSERSVLQYPSTDIDRIRAEGCQTCDF